MEQHSVKRKKRKKRTDEGKDAGFEAVARGAVTGGAGAVGCMLALAFLSAALCMLTPDPLSLSLPVGMVILYLSAAIGGCISAIGLRSNIPAALTASAFCGFILFILTGICAVLQGIVAPDLSLGFGIVLSLILRLVAMAVAVTAAYIFCRLKPKPRHRRR